MPARPLAALLTFSFAALVAVPAAAQVSNCQAIAQNLPGARLILASTAPTPVDGSAYEVSITYVGHSTFRIEAPDGTVIATDYAGIAGRGRLPDVVTMNHAHSSHYTPFPDPGISHVLRGWNPDGGRAEHFLQVGEVLVRNVPTDIRNYAGVEESGNSIFIFEIQGLCIGHLGHLHQELNDGQIAEIGRLDVVFVPIDGTYTMDQEAMMDVVARLRGSIAIPMHWWSQYGLANFLTTAKEHGFATELRGDATLRVSLNTLPRSPTVVVLSRQVAN